MNRRSRGILTVAVSLALGLLFAACSTTQTAGRQIDDTTIHAAVSAKLTGDRFSNLVNIDINVTNGVVTLAGEVPNATVKADAASETGKVSGVVKVINNLQVKSPPAA
jgi:osmotically-inducible protein OsmY